MSNQRAARLVRRIPGTDVSTRWLLGVSLSLVAAASMWLYSQLVMLPYQQSSALAEQSPRGNLSDLYPRWLGARELLLHKRDPYGDDITREIQTGYYGRPLDPTRPNDPKDQQGFAYPVFVVLMLAPTVTLPFSTVHRIFFWLFAILTTASVPLWLRTLGWRLSRIATVTWILLTLGCFPAVQGLRHDAKHCFRKTRSSSPALRRSLFRRFVLPAHEGNLPPVDPLHCDAPVRGAAGTKCLARSLLTFRSGRSARPSIIITFAYVIVL